METTRRKIILGFFAVLILTIVFMVGFVISAKWTAANKENIVISLDQKMQNVWSMVEQGMKMAGFSVKDFDKTFLDSIKSNALRYENDKEGMMKWVQEASNQMSPDIHKKFMDIIEKAYAKKEMAQNDKIAFSQSYNSYLSSTLKGWVSRNVWNFPTQKVKKIMDRVIVTSDTAETFETGIEKEVTNPFQK